MSVPVVDVEGEHLGIKVDRKVFINIWFRHVIMTIYSLNQALILIAIITENNL